MRADGLKTILGSAKSVLHEEDERHPSEHFLLELQNSLFVVVYTRSQAQMSPLNEPLPHMDQKVRTCH